MEFVIKIKDIQYGDVIETFLPFVKEKLKNDDSVMGRSLYAIACLPTSLMRTAIDALPQETKDEFVVYLFNRNRDRIAEVAEDFMKSKGISMQIEDVLVK